MSDDIIIIIEDPEPDIINVVVESADGDEVTVEIVYPEGAPGPQGPPGPQGEPGLPGAGFNYVHSQMVPSTLWTIAHNLNGFPNATFVQSDGAQIDGDVTYVDLNTITFEIAWPVSGKAYLS